MPGCARNAGMRRNQLRQPQCCFGHCSPLVVGGERSSVSPQVIKAADAAVAIPMLGMANSLNVATGSVTFYDLGCPGGGHANSSSNSFASFRSRVSNPSVNSRRPEREDHEPHRACSDRATDYEALGMLLERQAKRVFVRRACYPNTANGSAQAEKNDWRAHRASPSPRVDWEMPARDVRHCRRYLAPVRHSPERWRSAATLIPFHWKTVI